MKNVDIVHNPFRISTSICIDGRGASINGVLANYQTIGLPNWGTRFFNDVRLSANDNYRIHFLAPGPECRLFQRLGQNTVCSEITVSEPEVLCAEVSDRLMALEHLMEMTEQSFKVPVVFDIYSDLPKETVVESFDRLIPKVEYITHNVDIQPLASFDPDSEAPYFILCANKRSASRLHPDGREAHGCMLILSDENTFQLKGHCFQETVVNSDTMLQRLFDYMDILIWENVLREAMSRIKASPEDESDKALFLMDKIEPTPFIKLPETIEFDVDYEIQAEMLPSDMPMCECTIQTSDAHVISADEMTLTAQALGEAMIQVYVKNDPLPIVNRYIRVEKRNRIRSLDFEMPKIIRIGDTCPINVTYEPKNADNVHEIAFASSDQSIANVRQDGNLLGVEEGEVIITVKAGKASKQKKITVVPRLQKLSWITTSKEVFVNTAIKVELQKFPARATYDKIRISVYPPSAGVYDERTGLLQANYPGFLTLIANSEDGSVSDSLYFEAKESKKQKKILPWIIIAGIILCLWFLLNNSPF